MGTLENLLWILMIWILVNLSFYEPFRMSVNSKIENTKGFLQKTELLEYVIVLEYERVYV